MAHQILPYKRARTGRVNVGTSWASLATYTNPSQLAKWVKGIALFTFDNASNRINADIAARIVVNGAQSKYVSSHIVEVGPASCRCLALPFLVVLNGYASIVFQAIAGTTSYACDVEYVMENIQDMDNSI